jgi:hypothetical protein
VDSVRNVVGHVRRSLDRNGHMLAPAGAARHLLKGMVRQRLIDYGVALPVRAEPFTAAENTAMKSMRPGQIVGGRRYDATSRFWAAWRMVDTFGDQSGSRKSEVAGDDIIHYTWGDAQVVVTRNSPAVALTPDVIPRLVPGVSYLTVVPLPSKADFDGTKHGPNLMTFLYNPANPMSFAAAAVAYVELFGAHAATAPLFTTDGGARWTGSLIDSTLRAVMAATLDPRQRVGKTYHSKRVWLACALMDRGSPEAEIQMLERWASPEALRLYARMNHLTQARLRDGVQHADVLTVNATRRPRCDYTHEELEQLERLADTLDGA